MVYVNTHGFMLNMQFFILLLADFRLETPNTNVVDACHMSPENKLLNWAQLFKGQLALTQG